MRYEIATVATLPRDDIMAQSQWEELLKLAQERKSESTRTEVKGNLIG
ncbi:MAG: hypothetical protein ACPL5I_01040 [Thermodesulfobacteriota bacterium]